MASTSHLHFDLVVGLRVSRPGFSCTKTPREHLDTNYIPHISRACYSQWAFSICPLDCARVRRGVHNRMDFLRSARSLSLTIWRIHTGFTRVLHLQHMVFAAILLPLRN